MAIDLEAMKARLEAKRAELLQSIGDLTEASPQPVDPIEASEGSQEFEDAAVDINEMEDERAIRENERELLGEVEAALARIEQGTYGICTNCGQPIDEKRLEAIPWAALCITCEERLSQTPAIA
jgi:DnaK suppressor protein